VNFTAKCLIAICVALVAIASAAAWGSMRARERMESRLALAETRLLVVEERAAKCCRSRGQAPERPGDFPPWYGGRPADEKNLLVPPSHNNVALPPAMPK
jgi:hypothetical protein